MPVVLLIKYKEDWDPLSYLKLRSFKEGVGWTVGVSIFFIVVIVFLNGILLNREVSFQMGFHTLLNTVLLVGLIEEIVFRGFILRKLMDVYQFWKANIITAALFTVIHFPIWFYKGLFASPGIAGTILTIFVLGWMFGAVYKKSNSLWSVIIIHSLYNFLVVIFN